MTAAPKSTPPASTRTHCLCGWALPACRIGTLLYDTRTAGALPDQIDVCVIVTCPVCGRETEHDRTVLFEGQTPLESQRSGGGSS